MRIFIFDSLKLFSFAAAAGCEWKSRSVTVQEGRVVMRKHPEDDHHPECNPILLVNITPYAWTETCVRKFDRTEKDYMMPSTT